MHKIGFLGHGASGAIYALYLKILTKRNIVAEFHRENVSFTRKTTNCRFSVALWAARSNVCDSSLPRWKADSRLSIGYN